MMCLTPSTGYILEPDITISSFSNRLSQGYVKPKHDDVIIINMLYEYHHDIFLIYLVSVSQFMPHAHISHYFLGFSRVLFCAVEF